MDAVALMLAELKDLEVRSLTIRGLLLRLGVDPDGEDEAPAADAPVAAAGAKAEGRPRGKGEPARRLAPGVWPARLRDLLTGGPLRVGDLVERTGAARTAFVAVLRTHPWFEQADPGNRLSPWRLTEAGRQSLSE